MASNSVTNFREPLLIYYSWESWQRHFWRYKFFLWCFTMITIIGDVSRNQISFHPGLHFSPSAPSRPLVLYTSILFPWLIWTISLLIAYMFVTMLVFNRRRRCVVDWKQSYSNAKTWENKVEAKRVPHYSWLLLYASSRTDDQICGSVIMTPAIHWDDNPNTDYWVKGEHWTV